MCYATSSGLSTADQHNSSDAGLLSTNSHGNSYGLMLPSLARTGSVSSGLCKIPARYGSWQDACTEDVPTYTTQAQQAAPATLELLAGIVQGSLMLQSSLSISPSGCAGRVFPSAALLSLYAEDHGLQDMYSRSSNSNITAGVLHSSSSGVPSPNCALKRQRSMTDWSPETAAQGAKSRFQSWIAEGAGDSSSSSSSTMCITPAVAAVADTTSCSSHVVASGWTAASVTATSHSLDIASTPPHMIRPIVQAPLQGSVENEEPTCAADNSNMSVPASPRGVACTASAEEAVPAQPLSC